MSGLFSTSTPQQPDYTGLQVQTAAAILPIPLCFGLCKNAPNIIWYNGFRQSGGAKGAKGGIFTPNTNTPTYQADLIMGLCEGPITGIAQIWKGMQLYDLSDLNSEGTGGTKSGNEMVGPAVSLFTGTSPQTPWSYLTSAYPSQALGYQGTAYIAAPSYYLTSGATLDPHNFEIQGILYGSGFNGLDADPAQLFTQFITNAQWGAAPGLSLDTASISGSSGDASYSSYCAAVGLALSPSLGSVETASSVLTRWLQLTNTAAVWSGGQLKLIPYGDTAIVAGTSIAITEPIEIPIGVPDASGNYPGDVTVRVTFGPQLASVTSVTDSVSGSAYTAVGSNPSTGQYSVASGVFTFNAGNSSSVVDIEYVYAVPCSFTPDLTPVVQLDDDDYCDPGKDKDPVEVDISDPFEAYNVWRLEISDRNNAYNTTPQEARDQSAQDYWGLRVASTVTAHEICSPQIGVIVAQLMLQRGLYVRANYRFTLSWEYIALDPMDIVGITDALLGLDQEPVRIVSIEENDDGLLDVVAEELPPGIGTATRYATATAVGTRVVTNAPAAAVNTPTIFEPPAALVGSTPQVWIGASASSGGAADPNWGGCNVFLSTDGSTYGQIGTAPAAKQGVLTSSLAAYSSANPDTADTLAVNMASSGGVMATSTDLNASLAVTLCVVENELLSYATSTLTSTSHYALTYLYRGLYGTAAALHASGAPFCLLDDLSIFKFNLPSQFIGVPLYIKLQSFNAFGLNQQPLSTCTAYNYTPTGPGGPAAPSGLVATGGAGSAALFCTNPNSANFAGVQFYRAATGAGFGAASPVGPEQYGAPSGTSSYTDTVAAGTWDYFATALNSLGIASSPVGPATATVT
jgi:hypothetical protein